MSAKSRIDGSYLVACAVEDYDRLFLDKQSRLKALLEWNGDIEAFASPKTHFRMRANFQMWHDDDKNRTPEGFYYTMHDENDKLHPREVTSFPRGSVRINNLMTALRQTFLTDQVIYSNLFEVRFVTTKKDEEALIVLCYKRPLASDWLQHAEELSQRLLVESQCKVKIIGRARKQKLVTGGNDDEFIKELLVIQRRDYVYFQTEGAFSQPNAVVCEKMCDWAMDCTKDNNDVDLLELYCGGGTFTAPLSRNFRKVLATEMSKPSVELAKRCFKANNIDNIEVIRLSSEEFTSFYSGQREFQRVKEAGIDIKSYNIQCVFVDPPRAGLDAGTCSLISQFNTIIYVSCNPETLARDIKTLSQTHEVRRVAAFDQFPYTHHLESGVMLTKREENDHQAAKKRKTESDPQV